MSMNMIMITYTRMVRSVRRLGDLIGGFDVQV